MPPKTRSTSRRPVWDSFSWLSKNYNNNNGLPSFFFEGGYSFDMRQNAEDDYRYSVDEASKSNNVAYREWAMNIKNNDYSTLILATTREYWKSLDTLNEALLRKSDQKLPEAKRQKRTPKVSRDLLYLDGLRESVGTIITTNAKETNIIDYKSNYFTTLAMNKIIDISDISSGSHLDLFNEQQQQQIIEALSMKRLDQATLKTAAFDDIIEKFSNIENDNEFLSKAIKEIDETKDGNTFIKRIYLQILESMTSHKYLYDIDEDNSEQDYINKLYAPIMENCFHGCDVRLRWGDTIAEVCKKVGYRCKIDLRVTVPCKTCVDLSVVEYAKKSSLSKYYKDKIKTVLCSAIYFRNYQKNNNDIKYVPSMLISRLEGELLIYYQTDRNWFVVDKIADVDVPDSVELIRNGAIKEYINSLKYFKDYCLNLKSSLTRKGSMKSIRKSKEKEHSDAQKPFWFSGFTGDDSSDDEQQ
ncbi:unnamed protein product [Rhizopus stolonifer]